jgi:hypothetical protein
VKKNMALYSNKLFAGISDIHVVALDVRAREGARGWQRLGANWPGTNNQTKDQEDEADRSFIVVPS